MLVDTHYRNGAGSRRPRVVFQLGLKTETGTWLITHYSDKSENICCKSDCSLLPLSQTLLISRILQSNNLKCNIIYCTQKSIRCNAMQSAYSSRGKCRELLPYLLNGTWIDQNIKLTDKFRKLNTRRKPLPQAYQP